MSQSSSRPARSVVYQIAMDPYIVPMAMGYSIFLVLGLYICRFGLILSIVWVLGIGILSRTCPAGQPHWMATVLTPNFYSVQLWSGRRGIYQRCAVRRKRPPDCRALLLGVLQDQVRLPAALTSGRYQAITHETILRRLHRMPNTRVTKAKPIYTADLKTICASMAGGFCKHCKERCPFLAVKNVRKQFYYVQFEIEKMDCGKGE